MQTLGLAQSRSYLLPPSSVLSSPRLHLFLFFRSPFSSSSSSSARRTEYARQQHPYDESSKAIKVSVWWDFENCCIPSGVNVYRVAHRMVSALRSSGIRGPVSINAFGDVAQMSRATQEALISTGICLTHVPNSGKNSSDRLFLADLISWTAQNPPPVHFFLISGDSDFATILHRLRMNNYNVLLSSIDHRAPTSLLCAATLMWPWVQLVRGEDFTPRHFNYPPDGVYGSWYGHQKRPLDDPFAGSEQIIPYCQPDESMERVAEVKHRPIPESVVNGVRQILHLHPKGISLSNLRNELKRRRILSRRRFGFKDFSSLINSMTNILMLLPPTRVGGDPYVVLRSTRPIKLANQQAEQEQVAIGPAEPEKPSQEMSSSETVEMIEPLTEPVKTAKPSLQLHTEKTDKGIFGRFRKLFLGSVKNFEEVVKCEKGSSASVPVSVPVAKDKLTEKDQEDEPKEKDGASVSGLLGRIGRWFGFGGEKGGSNLFADPKLWGDVESFLTSPNGSDLVTKSRTREELIQGLHKAGTLSVKSLKEGQLIQLIDLIISEKKWILENKSSTFPFTLSIPSASTPSATSPENLPESIANPDQLPMRKSPPIEEVLSDCRKLVKEMLHQQPNGFDMSHVKPTFETKFGYMLEYKKLGYSKLSSLLQTLPGIKVDISTNKVYKCDKKEEKTEGENIGEDEADSNGEDSVFDELGPVSKEANFEYQEPSLSDEEFSDQPETELSSDFGRETSKHQSSLDKFIDSFSSSKDGNVTREEEPFGLDGFRRDNNKRSELWLRDKVRNQRSLRSHKGGIKFVSDEVGDDRENTVDTLLSALKKARESRKGI